MGGWDDDEEKEKRGGVKIHAAGGDPPPPPPPHRDLMFIIKGERGGQEERREKEGMKRGDLIWSHLVFRYRSLMAFILFFSSRCSLFQDFKRGMREDGEIHVRGDPKLMARDTERQRMIQENPNHHHQQQQLGSFQGWNWRWSQNRAKRTFFLPTSLHSFPVSPTVVPFSSYLVFLCRPHFSRRKE